MICVGIDVAKDKHDCFILSLEGEVLALVTILFPELEKLVPSLHMASVYTLLSEFPGTHQVASAHLTHLKTALYEASKGHYGREMAVKIREAAKLPSAPRCLLSPWN